MNNNATFSTPNKSKLRGISSKFRTKEEEALSDLRKGKNNSPRIIDYTIDKQHEIAKEEAKLKRDMIIQEEMQKKKCKRKKCVEMMDEILNVNYQSKSKPKNKNKEALENDLSVMKSPNKRRKSSAMPVNILNSAKKSVNNEVVIDEKENRKSAVRAKFRSLPKNVNEYKHLLSKSNFIGSDLEWVQDLREKTNFDVKEKIKFMKEKPSFYDNDEIKYKKRVNTAKEEMMSKTVNCFNKVKSNETMYYKERCNANNIDHLLRKRNMNDKNIIDFEVSLRDYRQSMNSSISNKWLDIGYKTTSKFVFSDKFPLITKKANEIFNETNSFQLKPIKQKLTKTVYKDRNIIKRSITYEKMTGAFRGEHLELAPFSQGENQKDPLIANYNGINLQNVRHLLQQKNVPQSNIIWQLNLRGELSTKGEKANIVLSQEYKKEEKVKFKNMIKAKAENKPYISDSSTSNEWSNIYSKFTEKKTRENENKKKRQKYKMKECIRGE